MVYVKGGTTYTASSTLAWSSRAGAVGNPITYVACNSSWVPTQGGVTISGSMTGRTTSGDLIHFTGSAVHNIVFNGFNLTTSTSSGSSGAHALIDIDATTSGGANIQIENCTLTTGTRGCVDGILVNARYRQLDKQQCAQWFVLLQFRVSLYWKRYCCNIGN